MLSNGFHRLSGGCGSFDSKTTSGWNLWSLPVDGLLLWLCNVADGLNPSLTLFGCFLNNRSSPESIRLFLRWSCDFLADNDSVWIFIFGFIRTTAFLSHPTEKNKRKQKKKFFFSFICDRFGIFSFSQITNKKIHAFENGKFVKFERQQKSMKRLDRQNKGENNSCFLKWSCKRKKEKWLSLLKKNWIHLMFRSLIAKSSCDLYEI